MVGDTPFYELKGNADRNLVLPGLDQGSSKRSLAVATELRGSNIVVDSIIVHSAQPNLELHAISVVTGGYSLKADDVRDYRNALRRPD
jgi:hypothetical protein